MLGASTKISLCDRLAQATRAEATQRLRVNVVVQGTNLEIDSFLGTVIEEADTVAKRAVAEQWRCTVQEDDVDLWGPERRCRRGAEGKAELQSLA